MGLSQICGVDAARLLTSKFMGWPSFDNKFTELYTYVKELETLSLMSATLSAI